MEVLIRIKRLVIRGAVRFTEKARDEMELDSLTAAEVLEAVVNAQAISKTLRSRAPARRHPGEKLYVIKGFTYDGTLIYTKGTIVREDGQETFYIFISSKIATSGD
jgi:hypothetical protein